MKSVSVEVPMSAVVEYLSGMSNSGGVNLGDTGDGYFTLYVRAVRGVSDIGKNQMVEFDIHRNGQRVESVRLSLFDLFHCEKYKRRAALMEGDK